MNDLPSELQQRIAHHGQEHVLQFWDELSDKQQASLKEQLVSIDFDQFELLQQQFANQSKEVFSSTVEPSPFISVDDECEIESSPLISVDDECEKEPSPVVSVDDECEIESSPFISVEDECEKVSLHDQGVAMIRRGELGILTVAGGQGTRLGWNGPKGTFPATPVTGKSLFQIIAEQILFASRTYGVTIPWYIMTSQENDLVTRSFLLDNNCFGLRRTDIFIFAQGEVPAINATGKILLASKHHIAMNPDGHGGVIASIHKSGGLAEMEGRGIKYLSYVQVDNPLAKVIDPVFLALHVNHKDSSAEASSKCVKKTDPDEPVGVFCSIDGRTTIVEYSDLDKLDKEIKTQVNSDGELVYQSGSIAIHMFSVEFLLRIGDNLPWHIAHKKVSCVSIESGKTETPKSPNAFKFERFVFDVLPLAKKSLILKTSRVEEFAPIKNATGDDSPASSHKLQLQRAVRWLQLRGIQVSASATVEISPLTAARAADITPSDFPATIENGEIVAL